MSGLAHYYLEVDERQWTSLRAQRDGHIIGDFPDPKDAERYLAILNGQIDVPAPKFKVGDRVRVKGSNKTGEVLGVTEPHYRLGFDVWDPRDVGAGATSESWLELAPPEPRATVIRLQPTDHYAVSVAAEGHITGYHFSKELAEHIAQGLNEHPDWTL